MIYAVKGDSHYGLSTGSLYRTEEIDRIYGEIVDECIKRNVKAFFDLGDIFHTNRPSPQIIAMVNRHIDKMRKHDIYVRIIEGNHEKIYRKGRRGALEVLSSSGYENIDVMDRRIFWEVFPDFIAVYIPWLSPMDFGGEEKRDEAMENSLINILSEVEDNLPIVVFAHANVTGATVAKDTVYKPKEFILPSFLTDKKEAKKVGVTLPDLIFCGHIHKTQIIQKNPTLIVLGTPQYNTFGELGNEKVFATFNPSQLERV